MNDPVLDHLRKLHVPVAEDSGVRVMETPHLTTQQQIMASFAKDLRAFGVQDVKLTHQRRRPRSDFGFLDTQQCHSIRRLVGSAKDSDEERRYIRRVKRKYGINDEVLDAIMFAHESNHRPGQ